MNASNIPMKDMEIMSDALISQKTITGHYNNYANESAAPEVKNSFLKILQEEHQIQAEVFNELNKRGWYKVQPADPNQISMAKQKYENMQQQLSQSNQSQS